MSYTSIVRPAVREDCPRMLELIKQLAAYQKTPDKVIVTLEHMEESGFGSNPVWWALVVEVGGVICGFFFLFWNYV
jgi:hypothetical protein